MKETKTGWFLSACLTREVWCVTSLNNCSPRQRADEGPNSQLVCKILIHDTSIACRVNNCGKSLNKLNPMESEEEVVLANLIFIVIVCDLTLSSSLISAWVARACSTAIILKQLCGEVYAKPIAGRQGAKHTNDIWRRIKQEAGRDCQAENKWFIRTVAKKAGQEKAGWKTRKCSEN